MRETRLTCDGCKAQVEFTSDDPEVENWVTVCGGGDFCPVCWKKMLTAVSHRRTGRVLAFQPTTDVHLKE